MSAELLLVAVVSGCLGAVIVMAAVLGDMRGHKKRADERDTEGEWPKVA
jgi:hypothetical protein